MEKKVSADESSTAEVPDNIEKYTHRKQDLVLERRAQNLCGLYGRHIALLYNSRTCSELGTSLEGIN